MLCKAFKCISKLKKDENFTLRNKVGRPDEHN
jgi:hypothetical protein